MYNITKNGSHTQYGVCVFVADAASDLTSAPTNVAPGSRIYCIGNSKIYIFTSSRTWVEYSGSSVTLEDFILGLSSIGGNDLLN